MKMIELFEGAKQQLNESTSARIQHAEDLIFQEGSKGALRAVEALKSLEQGKHQDVTVKWDGRPAIIFGRNEDGEFVLTDKSGFGAKGYDGKPTSSQAVNAMFMNRPAAQKDPENQKLFAGKMAQLYDLYEKSFPEHVIGYLSGDLLYFEQPEVRDGRFVFTPNVVTYSVETNSDIGQQIAQSVSGIVVHNFVTPDGQSSPVPKSIINQMISGQVMYFPTVTVERAPNVRDAHIDKAKNMIMQNGSMIDDLLNTERLVRLKMKDLPKIFYTYLNSKVDTGLQNLGSDFTSWLSTSKVTGVKQQRIQEYIQEHQQAFTALWEIIDQIMQIKNDVIQQFDSHDAAITASINGDKGGEGYVMNHPGGSIKLVNRSGFTAANRKMNTESIELDSIKKLSGLA